METKLKMPSWKRLLIVTLVTASVTIAVCTVLGYYNMYPFAPIGRVVPKVVDCSTVQLAELRPGAGLAWSRARYPDQFAPDNYATTTFEGLPDRRNERFMDVAAHAYSRALLSGFSYTDAERRIPQVKIEYLKKAETFTGVLKASGLKPNFAYQIKLRGIWEHRDAFERIGYVGRWRLPGLGTNYTDTDYEEYPDKHLVESYLLFDFFVTDPEGKAEKAFYLDSSLHVLWNQTTQSRKRTPKDSSPVTVPLTDSRLEYYANPQPYLYPQRIYAEAEGNERPPIGHAFLPPGRYQCEVVLTEESFHGYGDSGFWATVMRALVDFEVIDQPKPTPEPFWDAGKRVAGPLSLEEAEVLDIDVTQRSAEELQGTMISKDAAVTFSEAIDLPEEGRYYVGFEGLTSEPCTFRLLMDTGDGFEGSEAFTVRSKTCTGWRRFEIEITRVAAGRSTRLKIEPSAASTEVGLRKVGVYAVEP